MKPKYYTKAQATRLIKEFSRIGSVRLTKHAKGNMAKRDITMQDVLCAFRNGKVIDNPELDINTNLWKYRFIGNGIDTDTLVVITVIDARTKCVTIITVFKENKK
ncbi:MAG TPA: DUF4258 domain-containing protein [Nitrospirae bacterium]|nr:DUF4258 domain-containing protein [Nitrospirota bacterium]